MTYQITFANIKLLKKVKVNRMTACSRKRKANCVSPDCEWIKGKGCRKTSRRRSKSKTKSKSCSKQRKADCQRSPNCNWVVGRGCSSMPKKQRPPMSPYAEIKLNQIAAFQRLGGNLLDPNLIPMILAYGNMPQLYTMTEAASSGNLELLKYLIETTGEVPGGDVLHLAVRNGHLDIVRYLIEKHNVDYKSGFSSLIEASIAGHLNIVIYLSQPKLLDEENKEDLSILDDAFQASISYGKEDVVEYFLTHFEYLTDIEHLRDALWFAYENGVLNIFRIILEHVPLDEDGVWMLRDLIYAAQFEGYTDMIQIINEYIGE